ncbi:membrane hypothetical protein [Mesotoga infera]|nr:membrane hypothetical protein [Mesotoga infera]
MNLNLTKSDKIFLGVISGGYIAVLIYMVVTDYKFQLEGVGQRWIYQLPFGEGPLSRVNPLTIIMTWVVMGLIIFMVTRVKVFKIIPGKKQSLLESLLEYVYDLVKDSVTRKEYVRPIFDIAASLFLFILVSNIIGSFPGINAFPTENGGVTFTILADTWYAPTSDLNMNLMLALFVFVMSHVYAIRVKGLKSWVKSFFEPIRRGHIHDPRRYVVCSYIGPQHESHARFIRVRHESCVRNKSQGSEELGQKFLRTHLVDVSDKHNR